MSEKITRREAMEMAGRTVVAACLGGTTLYLGRRAWGQDGWQLNPAACIDSQVGLSDALVCERCAASCVLPLSAVRAVNDHSKCGRCCICPAYFDVKSAVGPDGLPSEKACPRDAIQRVPIGEIDPKDPANNYYEYIIDEKLCNGCGRCVFGCKEPAGLGSIRLEVRHNLCVNCNRCSIAAACPAQAYQRTPLGRPWVA